MVRPRAGGYLRADQRRPRTLRGAPLLGREGPRHLPEPSRWAGLHGIARVETEVHCGEQVSREVRYYLTSLPANAHQVGEVVRAHWNAENRLHWVLDVTFREDESRIRRDHALANFNTLRQFALNLLRREFSAISVKRKQFKAAVGDRFRAKVVFGQ